MIDLKKIYIHSVRSIISKSNSFIFNNIKLLFLKGIYMKDLITHLITERPVLFARYVIYIVSSIIIIIMVIIKKYKNRNRKELVK